MPRRPAARAIALAIILVFALSACTPTPEPSPTATAEIPSPSPTPTPEARSVAPGEKPPVIFGGDCGVAVPASVIAAATGLESVIVSVRDPLWTMTIDNVGGLVCEWNAQGVSGSVSILPQHAIGGAELSAEDADYYYGECGWGCGWLWSTPAVWVSGYATDLPELGRAEADRIGAEIGAEISSRADAAGLDWTRDVDGWWPVVECSVIAEALGAQLGVDVTTEPVIYHDPPLPATVLADIASHQTWCSLSSGGVMFAIAEFMSGTAWSVPWGEQGEAIDLGIPGVEAYEMGTSGYLAGAMYTTTDGVNAVSVEVATDSRWPAQEIATVFAKLTAAGIG